MSEIKKYCEGLDCAICDEKEPCIYKIANELEEKLTAKEQECEELKKQLTILDDDDDDDDDEDEDVVVEVTVKQFEEYLLVKSEVKDGR